jgi:hypothetical protein
MAERRNLVVVRAGRSSLHPGWLEGISQRNWDIVVSYFGSDPDQYRQDDVTRIDGAGPKWPALQHLFVEHPRLIDDYDFIWLPDDDLAASKLDINRMFDLCRRYDLAVAQPSLSWDSFISHSVTLQNRQTLLRFTNFVEIMAPCLSSAVLRQVLPMLNETLSGWGLDFIWAQLAGGRTDRVAIIDAVSVRHTRPVGGPNYKLLREKGLSPMDEKFAFLKAHGMAREPRTRTYAAIDRRERMIMPSRFPVLPLRLAFGQLAAVRSTPNRVFFTRSLLRLLWLDLVAEVVGARSA